MPTTLLWILILMSSLNSGREKLFIKPTSSVEIKGTSNVVAFTCKIDGDRFSDTVVVAFENKEKTFVFSDFKFPLPVDDFSCGNSFLTKDFKKTLCEEDHPMLTVTMLRFTQTRVHDLGIMDWGILDSEFTVAGVKKTYRIEVRRDLSDFGFIMKGEVVVDMCAFGIEAKSSLPMVKVDDDLLIRFSFAFDQL